jgi:hypothetical protein
VLRGNPRNAPFKILYQPEKGRILDHWRRVGLMAYSRGNMLLCIDEMGLLCEDGRFRQDSTVKNVDPILEDIVHRGRHRKLDVICTAQRPQNIARGYTSMCSELRVFHTHENRDLTYLEERMGESATSRLTTLPPFVFLHWTDNGVAIYKPKLKE